MIALLWDMANAHARNCAYALLAGDQDKAGRFAVMYNEIVIEIQKLEDVATVGQ